MIKKLIGKSSIEDALKIHTALSDDMEKAISLWDEMYTDNPPWKSVTVQTLNLPATIAAKFAKLVTVEASYSLTGSARAEWISTQLEPVWRKIRNISEYACAKGGIVFKPFIDRENVVVDIIQADKFFPTEFDENKNITGGIFIAQQTIGKTIYTRLERQEYTNGLHIITQQAFKSNAVNVLGTPCSLAEVPDWANIQEKTIIENLESPLFVYWGMPLANNIDDTSPLGVSIYSRAAQTIEQLDKQYSRLIWEFEGGEMAIHATQDLFAHRPGGKPGEFELPQGKKRLYRLISDEIESGKNFFEVFAPNFRDESLLNGFNTLLKQIEQQCGLAFGTLSDPQSIAKTATEIMSSKQESYSTISDIQNSLERALIHLVSSIDELATAGSLSPNGSYDLAFDWDDSIIVDKEARKQQFWQYVMAGKFPFWKFLIEFEGYTEDEAKAISQDGMSTLFEDE